MFFLTMPKFEGRRRPHDGLTQDFFGCDDMHQPNVPESRNNSHLVSSSCNNTKDFMTPNLLYVRRQNVSEWST